MVASPSDKVRHVRIEDVYGRNFVEHNLDGTWRKAIGKSKTFKSSKRLGGRRSDVITAMERLSSKGFDNQVILFGDRIVRGLESIEEGFSAPWTAFQIEGANPGILVMRFSNPVDAVALKLKVA